MSRFTKNLTSGFLTRSDMNWVVQQQKIAKGLKYFGLSGSRDCTIYVAKTEFLMTWLIMSFVARGFPK